MHSIVKKLIIILILFCWFIKDFFKIMQQREEIFGLEDDLQSAFDVFDKDGNVTFN